VTKEKVIHMGDAGIAGIKCGVKPTSSRSVKCDDYEKSKKSNWVWKPEDATCKRCIAIYKKACKR
jgi:hypothetical protein